MQHPIRREHNRNDLQIDVHKPIVLLIQVGFYAIREKVVVVLCELLENKLFKPALIFVEQVIKGVVLFFLFGKLWRFYHPLRLVLLLFKRVYLENRSLHDYFLVNVVRLIIMWQDNLLHLWFDSCQHVTMFVHLCSKVFVVDSDRFKDVQALQITIA